MHEHHRFEFGKLLVSLVFTVIVAVTWYRADLYPDQIPQTRAELIEAIASVVIIAINIVMAIIVATVSRRRLSAYTSLSEHPTRQVNTAEQLTQIYINLHGNGVVPIVAILCLTFIVLYQPQAAPASAPLSDLPIALSTATVVPTATTESPATTTNGFSSEGSSLLTLTAKGYGTASSTDSTPEQRKQLALLAAELGGKAQLAEQLVGAEIEVLSESRNFEITETVIRQTIHTWMPGSKRIAEKYDAATGEAIVTMQMILTEDELARLRQHYNEIQ